MKLPHQVFGSKWWVGTSQEGLKLPSVPENLGAASPAPPTDPPDHLLGPWGGRGDSWLQPGAVRGGWTAGGQGWGAVRRMGHQGALDHSHPRLSLPSPFLAPVCPSLLSLCPLGCGRPCAGSAQLRVFPGKRMHRTLRWPGPIPVSPQTEGSRDWAQGWGCPYLSPSF